MKSVMSPLLNPFSNPLQAFRREGNPNTSVRESLRLCELASLQVDEVRQSLGAVMRVLDYLSMMLRNGFWLAMNHEFEGISSLGVNSNSIRGDVGSEDLSVRKNVPLGFELSKVIEGWRNGVHFSSGDTHLRRQVNDPSHQLEYRQP